MLRKKDKENSKKQSGCEQENISQDSKKKKVMKSIGIGTAAVGATMALAEYGTRSYKVMQEEKLYEARDFNRKKMENQTYEIYRVIWNGKYGSLFNEDIDRKISRKESDINLLKKQLDKFEKKKKRKKEQEYSHLQALIQNKEICLDFLRRMKEKQEIISQHIDKHKVLTTERDKISFVHPIKKREFAEEIAVCEDNINDCYNEYRSLESEISESEKQEEIMAKKYNVVKRTGIKIFMVVAAIIVILICVYFGVPGMMAGT